MPVRDWGQIALLTTTLIAAEISMAQPARMMRRCDVHDVRRAVGGVRNDARSREWQEKDAWGAIALRVSSRGIW